MIRDESAASDTHAPACRIDLKVVPGASRSGVAGVLGDRVKVRVAAPPQEGRANDAVRDLLADALGVRPRDVTIVSGHGSPEKTARVAGVDAATAARRLGVAPDSA